MRIAAIHLLLAVTFAVTSACSSGEDTEATSSIVSAPVSPPGSADDEPAAASGQTDSNRSVTGADLQVSRTREGNGGIIAVAGEMTMEFDYSPPQGHCRASDGKFEAKGIDIDDAKAGVSIKYETVVAPDTGRVVGRVFFLEVRKDGYTPWSTNSSLAGSIDDISQDILPGGGISLTVTGTVSGFQDNRVPTGIKSPFQLEATCGQ